MRSVLLLSSTSNMLRRKGNGVGDGSQKSEDDGE